MSWFLGLDAIVRRVIVGGLIFCLLVVVLLTLSWCNAGKEAARLRGEGRVADAQAGLGADAMKRADDLNAADRAGQVQTDANTDFITGADNAKDPAGEAGNRGRLAFCDRQRVRQRPEPAYCAELRRAYPGQH